jgi:HD-GYP domain-containing protein (c-di-GMP phosphodiesterase class II)
MKSSDESKVQVLMDMAGLINSSLDPKEIRRTAIMLATKCVGADAASLLLLDNDTGELYFEVATGEKGDILIEKRLGPGQGIAGWVAKNNLSIMLQDVREDKRFSSAMDDITGYSTRSMIAVPVASKDRVLGVLQAINKLDGPFEKDDLEILETVGNLVATAIENAFLFIEQRNTFLGITLAFAEALEKRDDYTGGHTRRVCDYSLAIARCLGMGEAELDEVKLSAILHDIGKIGIADSILQKPGKLEREEFQEMCKHPCHGSEILSHLKFLRNMLGGVRHHHEKLDGTGYPDGKHGDEIPLVARIIAVADAFDAMTSKRSYRNTLTLEIAMDELKQYSGTQFDPEVVAAFFKAYERGEITNTWDSKPGF